MATSGISTPFGMLSRSSGQVAYVLRDRSPLTLRASSLSPLDLHFLGTPQAFVLSQDQTLHTNRSRLLGLIVEVLFADAGVNRLGQIAPDHRKSLVCTIFRKALLLCSVFKDPPAVTGFIARDATLYTTVNRHLLSSRFCRFLGSSETLSVEAPLIYRTGCGLVTSCLQIRNVNSLRTVSELNLFDMEPHLINGICDWRLSNDAATDLRFCRVGPGCNYIA